MRSRHRLAATVASTVRTRSLSAGDDPTTAARVLALLHAIGAVLALAWLALPHGPRTSQLGVAACVACAALTGVLLFANADRVGAAVLRAAVAFTTAFAISGAIYFSHATGSAFGLFYLWATLYSFYFFSARDAAIETLLVAGAYAAVLLAGASSNLWSEELARWALTVATVVVSGCLVRFLTARVRRVVRRFEHGLDVSSLGVALIDADGRLETANPALCELLGLPREDVVGSLLVELTAAGDREGVEVSLRRIATGAAASVQFEQDCLRAGGEPVGVSVTVSQLSDERPFAALLQVQDMTDWRRVTEALRTSEQRHRLVFDAHPKPMWIFDSETLRFLAVNQAAVDDYGYSRDEFARMTVLDLKPAEQRKAVERALLIPSERRTHRTRHVKRDGSAIEVEVISNELPGGGRRARLVMAADVTDRDRAERLLRHQADHDPLTGLVNRRRFEAELALSVAQAEATGEPCSVLVLDVDHLKYVNDSFGHAAGDALLRQIASALRTRMRRSDLVARIGGDEFAILLRGTDAEPARAAADDLLEHLRTNAWHGLRRSTASIGLASFAPKGCSTADSLLVAADVAMYEAKEAGRDRLVVSSGKATGVTWVEDIRDAIDSDRLVLHTQPILDLRTGEIAQEELLVRMVGRDGELVSPATFIPAAERFGLIHEIDRWVVRRGVEVALSGRRVEVNLSAHSIGDREVTRIVSEGLDRGMHGENLIFEITETAAAANFAQAREFAERLTRLGCGFALDDFGTGFGSFTYLKHVPAEYLKIDMEFVRDLSRNAADRRVVRAIVSIAEGFGQRTVAEGVEDEATLELLRDHGVHYAQGYFIGRPKPLEIDPRPADGGPLVVDASASGAVGA